MSRDRSGWVVVACAFTLMFVGFGVAYSFAAFFKAFQAEFAASRAHVSLVFSLCALLWFSIGVPGGLLADRFGPRGVCLAGALSIAAGLAAAAHAHSLTVLYATYSIGIGVGIGLAYVPSVAAVQHWFTQHRVLAGGIAVSGIGAGNLLVPPLAAWWIELWGWRGAYLGLMWLTLLAAVPAALLLGGRAATRAAAAGATLPGMSLAEAMRSRLFWLMYAVAFLVCVGFFVPMVHLAPYAQDLGLSEAQGVSLVSLLGLGSLLGRFLMGGIAERLGHARSLVAIGAGLGLLFLVWWVARSYWLLAAFAVSFGTLYGGYVALAPTLSMELFGPRSLSAILGALYTAAGLATLIGPTFAGASFDATGSYDASILGCAALSFAGAAIAFGLRAHFRPAA
ncbi:MAG TPA: MFS transporter [Burkholderiales bacterium]|nr:MFS transporter [Burkholderiales bacterium]